MSSELGKRSWPDVRDDHRVRELAEVIEKLLPLGSSRRWAYEVAYRLVKDGWVSPHAHKAALEAEREQAEYVKARLREMCKLAAARREMIERGDGELWTAVRIVDIEGVIGGL